MKAAMTLVVLSVFSVGCARQHRGGTVVLEISPGEGTISVTDLTAGGQRVCTTDCELTYARGSRLDVELRARRAGHPTTTRRLDTATDLRVRGEWDDRSGQRVAGGIVLGVGLGVALVLLAVGAEVASNESTVCSGGFFGCVPPATSSWIVFGTVSALVGGVATIVGAILLATDDRPVLRHRQLPPRVTPYVAPLADGAMLGVAGEL
ncbi:MAG: hypothetical protein M3Y87_35625 [Myxococcota bacterium]|nr:hypothetical protein [Myxococcota bacterium]